MRFFSLAYRDRPRAPRFCSPGPVASRSAFRYVLALAVAILLGSAPSAFCTILHVSSEAEISGDGRTWETAFDSLAEALTVAATDDQIWVQGGTYNEAIELIPGIELYGGFAGTEATHEIALRNPDLNITTIDAVGLNSSVIIGATAAIIDGFTITGGRAPRGGGIFCQRASITIRNCNVENNYAEGLETPGLGGGIFCEMGNLALENCGILNNSATSSVSSGSETIAAGGGVYLSTGEFTLRDCRVHNNVSGVVSSTSATDTDIDVKGGGAFIAGSAILDRCRLMGNHLGTDSRGGLSSSSPHTVKGQGGGLYAAGKISLKSCQSIGNGIYLFSINGNPMSSGGGLFVIGQAMMANCIFSGNSAYFFTANGNGSAGGQQIQGEGFASLIDCSFGRFYPPDLVFTGHATVVNSILTPGFAADLSSLTISYSNILGSGIEDFPNAGNISEDPKYVDESRGDFRLRPDSPCIDAGTDVMFTSDITGAPRPVDIPGVGRDGPGAFDMGAYEFQLEDFPTFTPTPTATVTPTPTLVSARSDIDEDGLRNQNDLFVFQSDWQKPAPPTPGATLHNERSNINLDQGIDVLDLLILLSDWKKTTD